MVTFMCCDWWISIYSVGFCLSWSVHHEKIRVSMLLKGAVTRNSSHDISFTFDITPPPGLRVWPTVLTEFLVESHKINFCAQKRLFYFQVTIDPLSIGYPLISNTLLSLIPA